MKKINKEDMKKVLKLLKEIKINEDISKSKIFFPINTERKEIVDGLELNIKYSGSASKKVQIPGIVTIYDENEKINKQLLAYADLDYSPQFDIIQHLEIMGKKIPKDLREFLVDAECYLVKEDYISAYFNIN